MSTAAMTEAATWQIDPAHTTVEFAVKHMMFTTVRGHFSGVTGTITYDPANLENSSVNVEIDATTINTRDEKRDEHLRSADFLSAEEFGTLTFKSTKVSGGGNNLKVVGDLTIRGETREVTMDASFEGSGKNPWGQEVAGFTAKTEINRHDYGLNWNAALEAGGVLVGEKVKIQIDVQATRQAS